MSQSDPIARLMQAFKELPGNISHDRLMQIAMDGRRAFYEARVLHAAQSAKLRPSDHPPHPSVEAANRLLDDIVRRHNREKERVVVDKVATGVIGVLSGLSAPAANSKRADGMDAFRDASVLSPLLQADILTRAEKRRLLEDLGLWLEPTANGAAL